jgi:hypothetical protein
MRTCLILLTAASLTACTPAWHSTPAGPAAPAATSARMITGEAIAMRYHDGNLLEALRSLRPRIVAPSGPDRMRFPEVYVDGLPRLRGIADLAYIRIDAVAEVRYLSPIEASTLFGTGHTAGAILVTMAHGNRR